MKYVRFSVVTWLVLVSVFCMAGAGKTITVGERTGAQYRYLNDAVRAANPGDTVLILAFAYTQGTVFIDKNLTIMSGDQDAKAEIRPIGFTAGGTTINADPLIVVTTGAVTLANVILQPKLYTFLPASARADTLLRVSGSANVILTNVEAWVHGWTRPAFEVFGAALLAVDQGMLRTSGNKAVIRVSESGSLIIMRSTIRSLDDSFIDLPILVENAAGGKINISNNKGLRKETDGTLRVIGAIAGTISILDSNATVIIADNDIAGYFSPGAVFIRASQNVTVHNNYIAYFGQSAKDFANVPAITVDGATSVVDISYNTITSNGGCGVFVKDRGATVQGTSNRIYLNCVSSRCQKKPDFKNCMGNCCPCDYNWPSDFGCGRF